MCASATSCRRDEGHGAHHQARREGLDDLEVRGERRDGHGARAADVQPVRAVIPGGAQARRDTGPRGGRHGDAAPVLHRPRVRPLPPAPRRGEAADGNKAEISHDWLAGIGEATVDSSGHLLTYSGARTTYKVEARRVAEPPDVQAVATQFAAAETKSGGAVVERAGHGRARRSAPRHSPWTTAGRSYAGAAVRRHHSVRLRLAHRRERRDAIHDVGADHARRDPRAGGRRTRCGRCRARSGVELIVNKQTGQWGTSYDSSRDLGRRR